MLCCAVSRIGTNVDIIVNDPHEQHNLNASEPAITARLLTRFAELSGLAQTSGTATLQRTVDSSAPRSSWGSVMTEDSPESAVGARDSGGYGACAKMALQDGWYGPWLGAACEDQSGFCGLAGKTCATPSNGGLGSSPTEPYFTGTLPLDGCMDRCRSDGGGELGAASACSCFDWSDEQGGTCRLHNTSWAAVAYAPSRAANFTAYTRATDPHDASSRPRASPQPATGSTSSIVDGRLHVDGQPFFPVGMYVHDLTKADWAWMQASGINTVLTYTNGWPSEAAAERNLTSADMSLTRGFLDAAHAHGVKVFLNLKDLYEIHDHAPNQPAIVTKLVTAFSTHQALLGWYLNDEYKPDYIPTLEKRKRLIESLDPHHVTYSVENTGNTTRLKLYRNTSTLFGIDSYPWFNASQSTSIATEATELDGLVAAFGSSPDIGLCTVFQIFSWEPFECSKCATKPAECPKCFATWPSYEIMRAMAFLQPLRGSFGLIQYHLHVIIITIRTLLD